MQLMNSMPRVLKKAKDRLSELPVCYGEEPKFSGFNRMGIRENKCSTAFARNLQLAGMQRKAEKIEEQVTLIRKVKIALRVDGTVIEIKSGGLFSSDDIASLEISDDARAKGWRYVSLSYCETSKSLRTDLINALGIETVVILYRYESIQKWEANAGEWGCGIHDPIPSAWLIYKRQIQKPVKYLTLPA